MLDAETQIDTTKVTDGEVPTYAAPTKDGFDFAGWTDGENTYAPDELPKATGDVTYTAVFTEAEGFVGHSISLNGDIGAGEEGTCGTVTIEDGANIIYK